MNDDEITVKENEDRRRIMREQSDQISKQGARIEELEKHTKYVETERADITKTLVRLQDELKELHAPGKVAFLKSALAGCETLLKAAEAERDKLHEAAKELVEGVNYRGGTPYAGLNASIKKLETALDK